MATFSLVAKVIVQGLEQIQRLTHDIERADAASKKAGRSFKTLATNTKKAGEGAKEAASSFRALGGSTKAVGDTAEEASQKVRKTVSNTKKTAKEADSLRDKLGDLATMFRDSGDAGGAFGDVLDAASVATVPLGAGILALVAGVGVAKLGFDALSASVTRYIETNEDAERASERLDVSVGALNESVVDLVLGKGGLTLVTENLALAADDAAENIDKYRESADGAKTASEGLQDRINYAYVAMRVLAPKSLQVGAALDTTRDAAIALSAETNTLTDSNYSLIGSFDSVVGAANRASDAISKTVEGALVMLGLAESTTSKGMRIIGGKLAASPIGKRVAAGLAELRKRVAPRRGGGGGGGRRAAAPEDESLIIDPAAAQRDAAIRAGGLAGFAGFAALTGTGAVLKRRQDLARVRAEEDAEQQRRLDKAKRDAEALEAQAQQLGGTFFKVVATFQDTMIESVEIVKNGFGAMAGEIANFLGAFAVGESTLSEFGDAMADLAGNIANTFGDLFIKQGVGLALFNPGVGAALIAAGMALKFFGGMATAKGSANAGTGGGGGAGRSQSRQEARDLAKELTRELRPSGGDEGAVTNIEVIIGGRSIQPEMVAIVDDIARQRRSRYLGRRMGAF